MINLAPPKLEIDPISSGDGSIFEDQTPKDFNFMGIPSSGSVLEFPSPDPIPFEESEKFIPAQRPEISIANNKVNKMIFKK
jgi:hypothetical protein